MIWNVEEVGHLIAKSWMAVCIQYIRQYKGVYRCTWAVITLYRTCSADQNKGTVIIHSLGKRPAALTNRKSNRKWEITACFVNIRLSTVCRRRQSRRQEVQVKFMQCRLFYFRSKFLIDRYWKHVGLTGLHVCTWCRFKCLTSTDSRLPFPVYNSVPFEMVWQP